MALTSWPHKIGHLGLLHGVLLVEPLRRMTKMNAQVRGPMPDSLIVPRGRIVLV